MNDVEPRDVTRDAWIERMKVLGRAQARYLWLLLLFGTFFAALKARSDSVAGSSADVLRVPVVDLEIAASTVQSAGPILLSFLILAMMGALRAYTRARCAAGLEGDTTGLTEALDSTPNVLDLGFYTTKKSPSWLPPALYFTYPTGLTLFVVEAAWLWWVDVRSASAGPFGLGLRVVVIPLWVAGAYQVGAMWLSRIQRLRRGDAPNVPGDVADKPGGEFSEELPHVPFSEVVGLYQFYVTSYIKALWFYLAVNGALITAALTTADEGRFLGWVGLGVAAVGLIPIAYCFLHERELRQTLGAYPGNHGAKVVSTGPLRMLWWGVAAFWVLTVGVWIWIIRNA